MVWLPKNVFEPVVANEPVLVLILLVNEFKELVDVCISFKTGVKLLNIDIVLPVNVLNDDVVVKCDNGKFVNPLPLPTNELAVTEPVIVKLPLII
jgi:hypothetical protein